jgi:uncharacterized protein (DUF4415 family)
MPKKNPTGARSSVKKVWIDPDDAPELTPDHFERADVFEGKQLVRRGRPKSDAPKEAVKLRLDPDVLAHFRRSGAGWQTRINGILRRAARLPATRTAPVPPSRRARSGRH